MEGTKDDGVDQSALAADLRSTPGGGPGIVGRILLRVCGADSRSVVGAELRWCYSMAILLFAVAGVAGFAITLMLLTQWPESTAMSIAGGLVWAVAVLVMERSFAAYGGFGGLSISRKLSVTLVPVALATLIGIIVSQMLVLVVFTREIDGALAAKAEYGAASVHSHAADLRENLVKASAHQEVPGASSGI
ncbi:DUF4407 domain-containing protein [Rhodococcus globerulus]|uniref:DUF4407 domain-containing protein n=1 Tax=Rhodococcus globerulus TaxID=33008 RepID=UPI00301AC818